jgi:hypothetical protein
LGSSRLALDVHNVELNLYKLSDLAINSHQLRSLAPAAIQQSNRCLNCAAAGAFGWRIIAAKVFSAGLVKDLAKDAISVGVLAI